MDTSATIFLGGDVMTGRGIDQILAHPSAPALHEPYVSDAGEYVHLAERTSGPVPRGAPPDYIWGDALPEWERVAPAARLANLETSITRSDDFECKGINYRMHPDNVACLGAARLDVCTLANNHVLDYGPADLVETLVTLEGAGIRTVGAGRTIDEAISPLVQPIPGGRLIVGACAHGSSGVPDHWAAAASHPGVHLLPNLSDDTAAAVAAQLTRHKAVGDVTILSIHWGDNWGYDVTWQQVEFAHGLVDHGIDVVFGHSSHHVRPIEIYHGHLVLYGCGAFIDDYEGIGGYEPYRGELVLMFFPTLSLETGRLLALDMTPLRIRRLRLTRASPDDAGWMGRTVGEVSAEFGTRIASGDQGRLRWIGE